MTLTPTVVVGLPPHQSGSDQEPPEGGQESSIPRKLVRQVVRESGWHSLQKIKIPLISEEGRGRQSRLSSILNIL